MITRKNISRPKNSSDSLLLDMDLQPPNDASPSKYANSEINKAVSHQQLLNYRHALERKLQQRRPREQLINQGIMPAAITAPSLLSQKTKLERAQTGDLLQKKIRIRPNRAQLIQRHILNDSPTAVDPSLLANQIKLKRKKLEDDLNERLAIRPGPLELVKDNILEQGTPVGIAVQEGNVDFTDTANSFLEPISPDSLDGSPEPSPEGISILPQLPPTTVADLLKKNTLNLSLPPFHEAFDEKPAESYHVIKKEGRSRKKSPKAKFKKYKYHEYRPPNGEIQKSSLPIDSPYALMLQQQQLYLQLQVLYQNYPQFVNLPSIPENTTKVPNNNNLEEEKPIKIEDMRVVDMRKELKMRGLPVSGSKTDLIERLKASLAYDQSMCSPDGGLSDSSLGSPGIVTSSSSPVTLSSIPPTLTNGHNKLGRSTSLPAHEARLQQVQMQLMANCKKLQTQLPPEVQQQLQHLQYLNLQTQLQQLRVQPQTNIQPKPIQFERPAMSSQQTVPNGNQQGISTMATVKKEPSTTDSCVFSQQPQANTGKLFANVPTTSGIPFFSPPQMTYQSPQVTVTQAMPAKMFTNGNLEQHPKTLNFLPGQHQPGIQGLLHLKAEASRLNMAACNEPELNHVEKNDYENRSGWNVGHENQIRSPTQGSPCHTPNIFSAQQQQQQQEQHQRTMENLNFNQARPKPDHMQRSYSEHQEEGAIMMHATGQEKQRSLSEPQQPFVHRRSCSLPSGQLFYDHVSPPPSYEAHMAAQIQRKFSQDYTYQSMPTRNEDMDLGIDPGQDREFTQELQRAMMKQDLGLDNDEILEILGGSVGNSLSSPDHTSSTPNHIAINSPIHHRQQSPQRFTQAPHLQHIGAVSKSPSTGYLNVHSPTNNQQFHPRLSKSCEDVAAFNNASVRQGMSTSTENAFADLDSIIMSPASPMRLDSDDHLMAMSNNIPIPNVGLSKSDPLGWLDLNSSPSATSPGVTNEVTYMNRNSPPATLYGTSPSLHNEHFPLPLFELDGTGTSNFSHDFSEAMDFCV